MKIAINIKSNDSIAVCKNALVFQLNMLKYVFSKLIADPMSMNIIEIMCLKPNPYSHI